ncbi:MAG TPA: Pr6Pr family membrane protein [Chitinophagaceae bacterium]|nr:Pr6Pr family membrane protein [Chitinophagaceae bacterium]
MQTQSTKTSQTFLVIGTIMGWIAVVSQFYLIIVNRVASVPETILRFFSFFTILINTLVALCFTFLLLRPASNWGRFFSNPKTLTAITVYISMVGIVYNHYRPKLIKRYSID